MIKKMGENSQEKINYEYVFKILFLGDSGVGKTSIITKFLRGRVPSNTEPTIGVDFSSKVVQTDGDDVVRLQIWDTAGAKRYRHDEPGKVYRNAVGVVLVFDVTVEDSFLNLSTWVDDLNATSELDTSQMVVMVVGNKCELPDHAVPIGLASTYARDHGFSFIEVSTDRNKNITELFQQIASLLLKQVAPPKPTNAKSPLTPGDIELKQSFSTSRASPSVPVSTCSADEKDGKSDGEASSEIGGQSNQACESDSKQEKKPSKPATKPSASELPEKEQSDISKILVNQERQSCQCCVMA